MKATYDKAMAAVYEWEGGYTDDKYDSGGPTNWGITIEDARNYWKKDATAADVRAMPKSVAADIYATRYAAPLCYDDLPAGVDLAVLDFGINSGIHRSASFLQDIVMVTQDGIVGPETLKALATRNPAAVISTLYARRLAFLQGLSNWAEEGKGWARRCKEGLALALSMAQEQIKDATVTTTTTTTTAQVAPIAPVLPTLAEFEQDSFTAIRTAVVNELQTRSPFLAAIVGMLVDAEFARIFKQTPGEKTP